MRSMVVVGRRQC